MVVTSWVMTVSTFQLFVGVVLAATLIDDLEIDRWQLGVLGAINTGVGAVLAPLLGGVADRLGARRSTVLVVIISAVALVSTAAAFTYWMLVLASAIAGIPQGASNPVTNKVIAEEVPAADQGAVTGVKQSGVQFAVFLAGAMLPTSSATIGWRWALAGLAGFTLLTALVIRVRYPPLEAGPDELTHHPVRTGSAAPDIRAGGPDRASIERFVRSVAVYAFLLGMTAGGVTRFYPLFSQEVLGFTETAAGVAVSITGLAAIAARLFWAKITDDVISSANALRLLAVGASLTAVLLLVSEGVASWMLWPAVVLAAFTVVAWNVVAMLAVIRSVRPEDSGRATGIVLLGFLGGLTISAPAVGFVVDRVDSYRPAWIALGIIALTGALVVRPVAATRSPRSGQPGTATSWSRGRARRSEPQR